MLSASNGAKNTDTVTWSRACAAEDQAQCLGHRACRVPGGRVPHRLLPSPQAPTGAPGGDPLPSPKGQPGLLQHRARREVGSGRRGPPGEAPGSPAPRRQHVSCSLVLPADPHGAGFVDVAMSHFSSCKSYRCNRHRREDVTTGIFLDPVRTEPTIPSSRDRRSTRRRLKEDEGAREGAWQGRCNSASSLRPPAARRLLGPRRPEVGSGRCARAGLQARRGVASRDTHCFTSK